MPQNEFQKMYEQFKREFGSPVKLLIPLLLVGGFIIVNGAFYTVQPDERAVVTRLGRYLETTDPGLHYKLPLIDKKIIIQTTKVHQEEFGFRTQSTSNRRTRYSTSGYDTESLMLTGDLNVADVEWVVQYKISDPFKFIFQSSSPIQTIRDVSESIMRRVVGDQLVNRVLTTGRAYIASQVKTLMQDVIDSYDLGINIVAVKLQDVNPPGPVKDSFNAVNKAKQLQEKLINEAEKAYNKVIPEARGRADEVVSRAKGYAEAIVNRAEGDAKKFEAILREYKKAPKITKKRIYLETMSIVFSKFKSLTIVDDKIKGLLPIYQQSMKKE
ncbi:MAG: membrane protease subunit HflK [Thermoproteota archaeon]|jgi:membrane protease subunit HflK